MLTDFNVYVDGVFSVHIPSFNETTCTSDFIYHNTMPVTLSVLIVNGRRNLKSSDFKFHRNVDIRLVFV